MNDFMAALKGEPHEQTPAWFMRQAGRYLPGYTSIRKKHSIKDICADRELTLKVTDEPLQTLGVDAAIIFSDITIPLEAMGFKVDFKEGVGPIISNSFAEDPGLNNIIEFSPENYSYATYAAIRKFKEDKPDFPIIGFSGGPLTLASYVVLGHADRDLSATKSLMFNGDPGFSILMDHMKEMVIRNCREQVRNGADAIQIFDSWAGFLPAGWFRRYADKYLRDIQAELAGLSSTIYFSTQTSGMLEELNRLEFDFLSLDWRCDLPRVAEALPGSTGLQGNLDPLMVSRAPQQSVMEAERIVQSMAGKDNYIFNLGHGVLPETGPETLREIVRTVHRFRGQS